MLPAYFSTPNGHFYIKQANTAPLYRLKKWGDDILVKEAGLSTTIVNTTNFQAIGLYNRETGWGGVTNFLSIPRPDIDRLKALQVEDQYQDKQPDWRSQKMNWLCKERGTIYFTKDGPEWRSASRIFWGTIALGNNIVQVEAVEDIMISTRGETQKRWRKMGRLKGFSPLDWRKPLSQLLNEGLVHRCYCAYRNDLLGDTPKGIIYSPFWSPMFWDFSGDKVPLYFYLPIDWMDKL